MIYGNKKDKKEIEEYTEYERTCAEKGENPMTPEDFLAMRKADAEALEEREKQDYLAYQSRVAARGEPAMVKEEWIAKRKPTGESRHDRFVRLAELRTTTALSAIEKLFALKGAAYESSEPERGQVITALKEAVAKLENHYFGQKTLSGGFRLRREEEEEEEEPKITHYRQ